jgi:hypothetical protein
VEVFMRVHTLSGSVPVLLALLLSAGSATMLTRLAAAANETALSVLLGAGTSGVHGDQSIPAITVGFDHDLTPRVSLTGLFGYTRSEDRYIDYFGDFGFTYSYLMVGTRGALHLAPSGSRKRWDAFAGAELSVGVAEPKAVSDYTGGLHAEGNVARVGLVAGGRCFITSSFGIQAETSTATNQASIGLFVRR